MVVGTYNSTHLKIIESGKYYFLKNGYERTNLRELCSRAGVTTGSFYRHFSSKEELFEAIVDPAVQGVYGLYNNSSDTCFDYIGSDKVEELWDVTDDTVITLIKYIYQNFHVFKILLQSSDGTKYVSFVDDLVNLEVKNSLKMLEEMKKNNIKVNLLTSEEFHILNHSYLSCIFESVMHDYSEDEAISYARMIIRFFAAGWKEVLGF